MASVAGIGLGAVHPGGSAGVTPHQPNPLLELVETYGPPAGEEGPVLLAQEIFGVNLDPWQILVLRAYGRGERRIAIRACHGPGKTFVAALCIWHQLLTRYPQNVVATAPSKGQLEDALLAEVMTFHTKLPPALQPLFNCTAHRIELTAAPKESFFSARTARAENPEALQGVHSDWVLLIADEASGVPEAIFEASIGSMSGEHATTLLLGNPVRSSGYFYDAFHRNAADWFRVHVSWTDSSRVTADFERQVAQTYGIKSNAYRVRVLGEFPLSDDDTVIPFEFIESARVRRIIVREMLKEVWGFDIAWGGSDMSALVRRNSMAVQPDLQLWDSGRDTMRSAGIIKLKWDETPEHLRPEWILGDVIGFGAGTVDRLRELGLPVRGINVAEIDAVEDKYRNLRAQLWFRGREWLETKDHVLPPLCPAEKPLCSSCKKGGSIKDCLAERLAAELSWVRYKPTSSGKTIVEAKADLKQRGFHSPNLADAFLLTFAVDIATMLHGSKGSSAVGGNWSQPVRRGRHVV